MLGVSTAITMLSSVLLELDSCDLLRSRRVESQLRYVYVYVPVLIDHTISRRSVLAACVHYGAFGKERRVHMYRHACNHVTKTAL